MFFILNKILGGPGIWCACLEEQNIVLITVQRDATQSSLFIILQVHSTCVGCQPHPSLGVHKTVTTASGNGHIFWVATSLKCGQAWPRWREVAAQKIWPVTEATSLKIGQTWPRWREVAAQKIWTLPEAVVTVLCTPDDGCVWHPKHVEWTWQNNRLLCVASRWTIINIEQRCTEP
jgi:hypothetical protein